MDDRRVETEPERAARGARAEARPHDHWQAQHRDEVLRFLPLMVVLVDVIVVNLTISAAVVARESLPVFEAGSIAESVGLVAPVLVVGWIGVLAATGAYRRGLLGAGTEEYRKVVDGSLLAAGAVGVVSYLTRYELSRGFFVLAFAIGIPALLLARYAFRKALQLARRRGRLVERVLIAGTPDQVDELDAVFRREAWLGYRTVGALTPPTDTALDTAGGITVVGNVDDVATAVEQFGADVVVVAGGAVHSSREMRELVWQLEHFDVQVVVTPAVTDVSSERVAMRPVAGLPMVHVERPRAAAATRWAKRAFDAAGASLILLALLPVLVLAAARVKLHDGGPVLFRQQRVGRDGTTFDCLKFRSMVVDAEARLAGLRREAGHEAGLFKLRDDPRVTAPGAWLRRYSLDELPQLWNVVRGDMSLVGPRPPLPTEVATYEEAVRRRLRVRPGMTGLWQVSGRSDLSWEDAVRLDLYYVDNWSMVQDLVILWRTIGAVLGSRGAY